MLALIPRKRLKEAGFRDGVMLQLLSLVLTADFWDAGEKKACFQKGAGPDGLRWV